MTDKKYTYFVSYQYNKGYGNSEVFCDKPINSIERVRSIEEWLNKDAGIQGVAIMNYILISEKPN